jgi:Protein of unknown function (DUF982)
MDRFNRLVVIETRRIGQLRNVGSVTEAAECLVASDWPRPHGPQHRAASRACLRVLAGEISPEAARRAFIEAAREAGIFVGERPLRG